jgi:hypothetical protein
VDDAVTLYVDLTADRPTKVDRIDVRIIGHQGWRVSNGKTTTGFERDVPTLGKELCGPTELAVGTRTFPLLFRLPTGTAPSHAISPAFSSLVVEIHVSIPWWPDGRYKFAVPVRIPPPPAVARTALVTRHPFDAKPGQPRLELSLASTTLAAGEPIVGSVAVFHRPRVHAAPAASRASTHERADGGRLLDNGRAAHRDGRGGDRVSCRVTP